jgi:tetratricopeptide (TPR) repeat protein
VKSWLRHRKPAILLGVVALAVLVGWIIHDNTERARWHVLKKELAALAKSEEAARLGAERARDRFERLLARENRRVRVGTPNFTARRAVLVNEGTTAAIRAAIYGLTGKAGEKFMNELVVQVFEVALRLDEIKLAKGAAVIVKDKSYARRAEEAEEGFDRRDAARSLAAAAKGLLDGRALPLTHVFVDDALAEDPGCMDAVFVRGALALEEGTTEDALRDANRVLAWDPECAQAFVLRARCELLRGERESALADVASALEREPEDMDALALRESVVGLR